MFLSDEAGVWKCLIWSDLFAKKSFRLKLLSLLFPCISHCAETLKTSVSFRIDTVVYTAHTGSCILPHLYMTNLIQKQKVIYTFSNKSLVLACNKEKFFLNLQVDARESTIEQISPLPWVFFRAFFPRRIQQSHSSGWLPWESWLEIRTAWKTKSQCSRKHACKITVRNCEAGVSIGLICHKGDSYTIRSQKNTEYPVHEAWEVCNH